MLENEKWLTNIKWFVGIVESRGADDPTRTGRVKVRCHGVHTNKTDLLPTSALPWAIVAQSVTSAAVSGIGESPTGLVEGSQVFGVFLDMDCQKPMILASLGGVPKTKQSSSLGFNDPTETYPLEDLLGQSDMTRLADERADTHPISIIKAQGRARNIPVAKRHDTTPNPNVDYDERDWSEPNPRYGSMDVRENGGRDYKSDAASTYPMNHVRETESGHAMELDDTPGSERMHQWHRSGTFTEIQADGSRVVKVVGDDFDIAIKDRHIAVRGNAYMTVNGTLHQRAKSIVPGNGGRLPRLCWKKLLFSLRREFAVHHRREQAGNHIGKPHRNRWRIAFHPREERRRGFHRQRQVSRNGRKRDRLCGQGQGGHRIRKQQTLHRGKQNIDSWRKRHAGGGEKQNGDGIGRGEGKIQVHEEGCDRTHVSFRGKANAQQDKHRRNPRPHLGEFGKINVRSINALN